MSETAENLPAAGGVHDATDPPVPIRTLPPGQRAVVCGVDLSDHDAVRLKRLGICDGRRVQVVRQGDPLILRVAGTRIGVSGRLAASIRVHRCGCAGGGDAGAAPPHR